MLTPSPYFTELSIATLVIRRKVFECTFVCGRPSDSIFCHTRRIDDPVEQEIGRRVVAEHDHQRRGVVHA